MGAVRAWHPDFRYYNELIGVECVRREDVERLMEALCTEDLRTCPHEIIDNTIVIPKEAVSFLPLDNIEHKKVELRDCMFVSDKVMEEVNRRFLANKGEPDYYTTETTCCRYLVPLTVVQEIEALNI